MLLFIFLGLIVKLTSVYGTCNVGSQVVHNFDFTKVGISALTRKLNQSAVTTAVRGLYFICGSINELSIERMRLRKFE